MKKLLLCLVLFVVGCSTTNTNSSNNANHLTSVSITKNSTNEISSSSGMISSPSLSATNTSSSSIVVSTSNSTLSSTLSSSLSENSSSSSLIIESDEMTIAKINQMNDNQIGKEVKFKGIYATYITDNMDKIMVFVDGNEYLYVRVVGGFNDYLKNRYLDCEYLVEGTLIKNNGQMEVQYKNLSNITSYPSDINYFEIGNQKNSIKEVYDELKKIQLNNKYTGYGKMVTFEGIIMSTDRDNSQEKVFVYDGENTIPVISYSKICDADSIGDKYCFVGCLNILKSGPALIMIDSLYLETLDLEKISFDSAIEKKPSDFASWYYVGDNINPPSLDDYSRIYKVEGYVADDSGRTTKYNLGLTDAANGDLNDVGIKKSIKGCYLFNHINMNESDYSYSVFSSYFESQEKISVIVMLYQFDTNNHGWKVVPIEDTIKVL